MTEIKEKLYKLPFSKCNNPNGWIEPTTFCQLKCPFCYRGCDQTDHKPEHKKIRDVLSEVDDLIRIRNIQTLTIAGGEPLLYPDLDQLIGYAISKKLNVMINTNGILIEKERLKELKKLGVTRIVIHVDKYQHREATNTESGVNLLRKKYCNLFREVGGIALGFIMPISGENVGDLDVLIPFFKANADIIRLCSFTLLCESSSGKTLPLKKNIEPEKVFSRIKELYGLEYCAYLGKTESNSISWLFAYNIFAGKKLLGSLDAGIVEFIQREYYKNEKKYLFVSEENLSSTKFTLYKILNKSTRRMFLNYLVGKIRGKVYEQIILVVNTPRLVNSEWDLCEGCPDAILYKGNLVPSCFLEKVKAGENILLK